MTSTWHVYQCCQLALSLHLLTAFAPSLPRYPRQCGSFRASWPIFRWLLSPRGLCSTRSWCARATKHGGIGTKRKCFRPITLMPEIEDTADDLRRPELSLEDCPW